jgi:hypothetical protein
MRKDIHDAFRRSISEQIAQYKWTRFVEKNNVSDISGKTLSWDIASVHHAEPQFKQLVADFVNKFGLSFNKIKTIKIYNDELNKYITLFKDNDLRNKWNIHHREHSNLKLVSLKENRKIPRVKGRLY